MKKFVLALTAAAAFAAFPSFASAADAQSTAAVKTMFDAMEMRKNMTAMYAEMQKAMPAMMRQQVLAMIQADPQLNAEQKKEAIAKAEQMLPGVAQAVNKVFNDPALIDEMLNEMVPLYANNYTVDEIKQLTTFYKSPVGRKMMTLTPKLSAEGMAIGQRIMTPRLGKLMQDVMQEVQKK
ncbi:DUF2059 domain-containing protein [Massilia sp. IC2-477]|uniref:DUF2059 domain-containing protein n=1 Tax=unclassified Massilia TaxID=2609279 RepID=UPI001D10A96E|nr:MULTISPECIES: DUF2059 domain-containing protein [unclassified Massilia]MCC2954541.1 DUF2059 domain-containing protein [Massilia sp. IC2-477]MCC2971957.1 DUF2059 domain-containing protein [Massilia sp. IC2-476]